MSTTLHSPCLLFRLLLLLLLLLVAQILLVVVADEHHSLQHLVVGLFLRNRRRTKTKTHLMSAEYTNNKERTGTSLISKSNVRRAVMSEIVGYEYCR